MIKGDGVTARLSPKNGRHLNKMIDAIRASSGVGTNSQTKTHPLHEGKIMTKYEKVMQVLMTGGAFTAKQLAKKATTTPTCVQARIAEMRSEGFNVMSRTINRQKKEYFLVGANPSKVIAREHARHGASAFTAA